MQRAMKASRVESAHTLMQTVIRFILLSHFLLFAYSFPLNAWAETTDLSISEIIHHIEATYESISDFKADFHQITRFSGFESIVASEGRLYIKKPGRLRWEYRKPNRNQVVVNRNRVWIYTPELKQVIIRPFTQATYSQIPVRLLAEVEHLDRDFVIERIDTRNANKTPPGKDRLNLRLRPRRSNGNLKKIDLEVDPKRYLITRIDLHDISGNRSEIVFDHVKTDVGLKDQLFNFVAPKGIEVIEMP